MLPLSQSAMATQAGSAAQTWLPGGHPVGWEFSEKRDVIWGRVTAPNIFLQHHSLLFGELEIRI